MKKSGKPEVAAHVDGANTVRASTIVGYVNGAHRDYLDNLKRMAGLPEEHADEPALEPRYRYNPTFESIYAMGPSIPAFLLMLFPSILMAVSVAREKEIGTITNFFVTPTTRLEFLVGKQLPYVIIGVLNFLLLTIVVVFVLQVPLKGGLVTLLLGTVIYVAAATGYGLLISAITSTQVAAVFAAFVLSILPTMMFSGMLQPVSTLEGGASVIGTLWPTTYYMHLSVGTYTKGLGLRDLIGDYLALAAFVPVFLTLAVLLLRKQEA